MITAEAAGLVLQIAKGVVKLTRRIDLVLAEKVAAEDPLSLPMPIVGLGPTQLEMQAGLRQLLGKPLVEGNDPVAGDRMKIEDLLARCASPQELYPFVEKYLPMLALGRMLDLDGSFMTELRKARPDWAADPELTIAAFYVSSGSDFRNKGYPWRLALTVTDVLAEFGAENTALFVRDKDFQEIVSAVLRRFGEADLQTTDTTKDLLRAMLKATLNGVIDAKDRLGVNNEWVNSLFDAIASARAVADKPDNFVMGLLQGEGYPLLVGAVMETAAGRLATDQVHGFQLASAAFLKEVSTIVESKPNFDVFFCAHWGDLLRAALKSVEKHGPRLLADKDPLLGKILSAVAGNLATRQNNKLLTREILVDLMDTIVGVVADNPDRIETILQEEWLSALVGSLADTMADEGVQRTFTPAGLEKMVKSVLQTFGDHPQLIIHNSGLPQELLGGVLKSVSAVGLFSSESLAAATVSGALEAISGHPELLKLNYPEMVAGLVSKVATLIKEKKITGMQGQNLIAVAVASLSENPQLLVDSEKELAAAVIDAVIDVSGRETGALIAGATLVDVVKHAISAVAVGGKAALEKTKVKQFAEKLTELLESGLTRAKADLGNRMGLTSLPRVLGQLVVAWLQGKIGHIDPDNDDFRRLFAELAERAQAANS